MSIYTKTGDQGQTSLASGQRVSKTDAKVETYGTCDELNAWLGWLRASLQEPTSTDIDDQLVWIQQRLFNLGASLADAPGDWIGEQDVTILEHWMDAMQATLPPVHAFVLPAADERVARCHICRTITRRLERRMLAIQLANPQETIFINRLSDYFYLLARIFESQSNKKTVVWDKNAEAKK